MVTAIVLIKAETNRIPDLADEDLADVISDKMRLQKGIVETETMIAFRAFSRQELEAGFELGLD